MNLNLDILSAFDKEWALVTAGTSEKFNTMTVSWGGFGTLWGKPVATVYIRPSRYTYEFLENSDLFTVSFFDEQYRKDLSILGTKSGRDIDKLSETALSPVAVGSSVGFAQARRTVLCRKLYRQEMDIHAMPEDVVKSCYKDGDVHVMFIGEVLEIR